MSAAWAASRDDIAAVLETLLRAKELVIADADSVWKALRLFKQSKADFADCLIDRSAAAAGADHTATFDRNAAKHCGMQLIG